MIPVLGFKSNQAAVAGTPPPPAWSRLSRLVLIFFSFFYQLFSRPFASLARPQDQSRLSRRSLIQAFLYTSEKPRAPHQACEILPLPASACTRCPSDLLLTSRPRIRRKSTLSADVLPARKRHRFGRPKAAVAGRSSPPPEWQRTESQVIRRSVQSGEAGNAK